MKPATTSILILACTALVGLLAHDPDQLFREGKVRVEGTPRQVRAGQFDSDGQPDLALMLIDPILGETRRKLQLLVGNGAGDFRVAHEELLTLGSYLDIEPSLEVADVNGDGVSDVAFTTGQSGFGVFHGDGSGGFSGSSGGGVGSGSYIDIKLDHLNDDDFLDAINFVEDWNGYIDYAWGDGTGGFPVTDFVGSSDWDFTSEIATGDVNEDGWTDVVIAYSCCFVEWIPGIPGGHFSRNQEVEVFSGLGVRDLALVDLDGDSHLDLVTSHPSAHRVDVRLGNGDGSFQDPTPFATERRPEMLHVVDVNGDGALDIISGHGVGSRITILSGDGDGDFPRRIAVPVGRRPHEITSADIDGDGDTDLIVTNSGESTLSVLMNRRIP